MPPAPRRLSTTTCWPSPRRASARSSVSADQSPHRADYGTMKRIGFDGPRRRRLRGLTRTEHQCQRSQRFCLHVNSPLVGNRTRRIFIFGLAGSYAARHRSERNITLSFISIGKDSVVILGDIRIRSMLCAANTYGRTISARRIRKYCY